MKKALRIILPILLIVAILGSIFWYFMVYDRELTRDILLQCARFFEAEGDLKTAEWFYDGAYSMVSDNDDVAIELAKQYKDDGNYTKAEYVLSHALEDGGGIDLYIALSKTYIEQDKILDAVFLLDNVSNPEIKAELEQIRPKAPEATFEPGYYSQYISVGFQAQENEQIYVNNQGEYPSIHTHAYAEPITLVAGENTLYVLSISDNGLVSPLSICTYTVVGVIEEVEFADPAVELEVRKLLNFQESDIVYTSDMWNITSFQVPKEAQNYSDLSHMIYLEELTIEDGKAGLTVLSGLTTLKKLAIRNTPVATEELSIIGALPNLKELTLAGCRLTTTAGLETATGLTFLDIQNNNIRNIDALSGMTQLQTLYLCDNAVVEVEPLASLKNLTILDISRNTIRDIFPICELTGLTFLNISENRVTDLSRIDHLTNLTDLRAEKNMISDISKLAACTGLTNLNLANNSITDISVVADLVKVARLDFSYNQVSQLPAFHEDAELISIDGSHNLLESLEELAGLHHLNSVYMDYNENIESVEPLASCHLLIIVNVYGTKVSEVKMLTDMSVIVNFDPTVGNED